MQSTGYALTIWRFLFRRLRTTATALFEIAELARQRRALLALDDRQLLAIGFSRQKTRYARALAAAVRDGTLDLAALPTLDDDAVDAILHATC